MVVLIVLIVLIVVLMPSENYLKYILEFTEDAIPLVWVYIFTSGSLPEAALQLSCLVIPISIN